MTCDIVATPKGGGGYGPFVVCSVENDSRGLKGLCDMRKDVFGMGENGENTHGSRGVHACSCFSAPVSYLFNSI